jgi:RHS repeat-associated protein
MTDKEFTGQQQEMADDYLGMYDYGARFYSTVLGRFLSADPLVSGADGLTANMCIDCTPKPGVTDSAIGGGALPTVPASGLANPQGIDRYSYVINNPLRYVDPTGLCFVNPFTGEMHECSSQIAFSMLMCSYGPSMCRQIAGMMGITGDHHWRTISAYMRYGVGTAAFEMSYLRYLSHCPFESIEKYAGYRGDLLWTYYNLLWQHGFIQNTEGGVLGSAADVVRWIIGHPRCAVSVGVAGGMCGLAASSIWTIITTGGTTTPGALRLSGGCLTAIGVAREFCVTNPS